MKRISLILALVLCVLTVSAVAVTKQADDQSSIRSSFPVRSYSRVSTLGVGAELVSMCRFSSSATESRSLP